MAYPVAHRVVVTRKEPFRRANDGTDPRLLVVARLAALRVFKARGRSSARVVAVTGDY
jgi:hypothetical protein